MQADPRLAPAAREWLERVAADDDSRRVAMAAESALDERALADAPAPDVPPTSTDPPPVIAAGAAGPRSRRRRASPRRRR